MMHKQEFLRQHPQFHTGVELYSDDGEKLGKIIDMEDDCVVVSKGTFFAREFTCRYDNLTEADADHAVLDRAHHDLAPWRDEQYAGWDEFDRANAGSRRDHDDTHLRLREEQLQAQKTATESDAHVRKVVHTEMQHLTVPVTKEELIVERTPVRDGREARPDADAFQEEDLTVHLRQEHAEATKRPVVKEDVHVAKRSHTEQERVADEVRKEELEVDRSTTSNPLRRH